MTSGSAVGGSPAHPRRLLLVIHQLARAGMERQCEHLALELAARGDQVTLACREFYTDPSPLQRAGVRVVDMGGGRLGARVRSLPRLARLAHAHDLVHCTGWDASLWGRLAAALARRPVVVTEHTPGRATQHSEKGARREEVIAWHNRLLERWTAASVVVARRQVEILRGEGVSERSIVHIPNGVPVEQLRTRVGSVRREDLGLPAGPAVVVHVARFKPQKRQEWSYETVAALRDGLGDVRLVFVGEGPGRAALERRVREDGADWVSFLGDRVDAPAVMALADLAVLPSSAEALPMVVLEAQALGVPQVVTDVGDLPAALDRKGGLLVDAGDRGAFEAACRRVLSERGLAERLREETVRVAGEIDSVRMAERYSLIFDAILAGRPVVDATA